MRLCLIIYKIDAVKGSEDATGYHLACEIITHYPDVTLISRHNNIVLLKNDPAFKNVNLVGIDVPRWLSFYKKNGWGITLYYYLWQIYVGRLVKKLSRAQSFDVVHQLNFHTDWAPHFLKNIKAKIVWGPLVHHPAIPYQWFPPGHKPDYLKDVLKTAVKYVFWYTNPALRRAIKNTSHIVFGNNDIPAVYQTSATPLTIMPYAGSHWPITAAPPRNSFNLLFVGRLIALKGPHLALDAFARFIQRIQNEQKTTLPHLTIIGSDPLADHIAQHALPLSKYITIIPWLDREELPAHYQQADYLLYPSLESQGLVVSEAISQSCPVITLADTGPAFVSQNPLLTVQPDRRDYQACVAALADTLHRLYRWHVENAPEIAEIRHMTHKRAQDLTWPAIAKEIMMFYS